jgi:hypothetical protein
MHSIAASDLITLWERGLNRHALDRCALLYACARPDAPAYAIPDLRLGEINARLLELRASWFGSRIEAHVDCRHCGERLGLTLAVQDLLRPAQPGEPEEVTVRGIRYRPPSLRDLAAVAGERDPSQAAHRLLAACLLEGGDTLAPDDEQLPEVEQALEELDPNSDLAFEVTCESCRERSIAQLDPGELLWDEINVRARTLLGEVHQLASAYGWSEREILSLTHERRASYLSMVSS